MIAGEKPIRIPTQLKETLWISATLVQQYPPGHGNRLHPFTPSNKFPMKNIKDDWGLSKEASPGFLLTRCHDPRPQQWAYQLENCCRNLLYRAGSFQCHPSNDLWPRRPDPDEKWEMDFSTFAKRPWCLASVLDRMVAFERPSADGRRAFPTPLGAIIFHNEYTIESQDPSKHILLDLSRHILPDSSKHILPGEVKCAYQILRRQQHFRAEKGLKLNRYRALIINVTPEFIRVLHVSCPCNDKLAPILFEIKYILSFDKLLSFQEFEDGWYTTAQLGTDWKVDDTLHANAIESSNLAILPVRSLSPSARETGKRGDSGESKQSGKSETLSKTLDDDGLNDDAESDCESDRIFDSSPR